MSTSDAMSLAAFITACTGDPYVMTVMSPPSSPRARAMHIPRLGFLGVVHPPGAPGAAGPPDDDGAGGLPAVPVPERRGHVDDLVEPARDEVEELHLQDRAHPPGRAPP